MNFWIEGERRRSARCSRRSTCSSINDEELRQLAGEHNIKRAAHAVLDARAEAPGREARRVRRACCSTATSTFFAPAYPLETEIDPTGAGDTFAGALLGYLAGSAALDDATLRRGLMMAATMASFCVEGVGTRRVERLGREDVSARLEELHELVRTNG